MQEPDFSQTCRFREKLKYFAFFRCKAFPAKSNDSIFLKMAKTLKNGLFLHFIRIYPKTGFFFENPKTLFSYVYYNLLRAKNQKKLTMRNMKTFRYRRTHFFSGIYENFSLQMDTLFQNMTQLRSELHMGDVPRLYQMSE